jgi:outer membrane protein assembly factor BamB
VAYLLTSRVIRPLLVLMGVVVLAYSVVADDWPELRGPNRDGASSESNLPDTWSPAGQNLIWRAPFGGRSGPVVLGDRVYLQNTVGEGATLQERLVALDARSGALVWEKRFGIVHSDVSPDHVGRTTPALDPETGHVYAVTSSGVLVAYTRAGVPLWIRDLTEEFGLVVSDGGGIASPAIDGSLIITSGISSSWGNLSATAQRFLAFDRRTGENVWIGGGTKKPSESTDAPPFVTAVGGARLLVSGGSDGAWYGMTVSTGERVWRYEVGKRPVTAAAIRVGQDLILPHRTIVSLPVLVKGEVTNKQAKWIQRGPPEGAFPMTSPVTDGQRIYRIEQDGVLRAFDVATGRRVWSLGTVKLGLAEGAAPVLGDGKIYVGTEDGRIVILRPRADGCDVLSETRLGNANDPERVTAGAAVSGGRVYVVTSKAVYAIGLPTSRPSVWTPAVKPITSASNNRPNRAAVTMLLVPADAALYPGQTIRFRVRLFDENGVLVREEGPPESIQQSSPARGQTPRNQPAGSLHDSPTSPPERLDLRWSLEGLSGVISPDGSYTAARDSRAHVGDVRVRLGALSGQSRVRVIPPEWETTFDEFDAGTSPRWWTGGQETFAVESMAGNNVLAVRRGSQALAGRARAFVGLHASTGYTIAADVRFPDGPASGDAGVIAQGYDLVLSRGRQRLDLHPWRLDTSRSLPAPFAVASESWYRLKLRVDLALDGSVQARGKAWLADKPEPAEWMIERKDPPGFGQLVGSPGASVDPRSEVLFDNFSVARNR